MKISSSSLYHYTSKFENLMGILRNGFEHRWIEEDLPLSTPGSDFDLPNINSHPYKFKVICFCDIPSQSIASHVAKYGKFAIGLTKNWGILNGITPIRYVHFFTPDLRNEVFSLIKDIAQNNSETFGKILEVVNENLEEEIDRKKIEKLPFNIQQLIHIYNLLLNAICNHSYNHYGLMRKFDEVNDYDFEENKFDTNVLYDERESGGL